MRVAVLGLGAMGAAIAERLEGAGADLVVWNRSPGPANAFAVRGVAVARSPAEAARGSAVVITTLVDGAAVEAVLLGDQGVLSVEQDLPIVVEMSTIDVATSERIGTVVEGRGGAYLRAPVSGNPTVARSGDLTILTSGDPRTATAVEGLLQIIGSTSIYLGGGEAARLMKLVLNLMVGGTMQLMSEAVVLGESHGLEREEILKVMASSAVGSPFVSYKAPALISDDYAPTSSVTLLEKDLRLVLDSARAGGVPVPLVAAVQQILQGCIGAGSGQLDFAALLPKLRAEAGLTEFVDPDQPSPSAPSAAKRATPPPRAHDRRPQGA